MILAHRCHTLQSQSKQKNGFSVCFHFLPDFKPTKFLVPLKRKPTLGDFQNSSAFKTDDSGGKAQPSKKMFQEPKEKNQKLLSTTSNPFPQSYPLFLFFVNM